MCRRPVSKLHSVINLWNVSFLTCMMSNHPHACLPVYPIPPNIQRSSLPDILLASNQLTKLTNDLQVSMSTHFDFFLCVCAHGAEKEFRGFTSSEDNCVPYSCVVHSGLGIKTLLRLLARKAEYHQTKLLLHRRIDTDLTEKTIWQRL